MKQSTEIIEELDITSSDLEGNLKYISRTINELDSVFKYRIVKLEKSIEMCVCEALSINKLTKQLAKESFKQTVE